MWDSHTVRLTGFESLMPIVIFGLFGFMSEGDTFQLDKTQIMAALPADQQAQIQNIDIACNSLASKFADNGLTEKDTEKAGMLYLGCLIGKENDKDFYDKLIWCFKNATEKPLCTITSV